MKLKKVLIRLVAILGITYIVACGVLYVGQDELIFDPSKLDESYTFRYGQEVEVEVDKGIYLNCLYLQETNSRGVVLYLHGNRGSNRRCLRQAEMLMGNGFDIFMVDYRGFGKSDGEITSQKQLYSDMQKVYDHLRQSYDESEIVIVGYSLGTGMASYLASQNDPRHLFLVAPYISFIDLKDRRFPLIPDFLVKYPLDNRKNLAAVNCPVTIFHGDDDEVIPFDSSQKLAGLNPALIELVRLDDAGHRRSIFHNVFRSGVATVLGSVQQESPRI